MTFYVAQAIGYSIGSFMAILCVAHVVLRVSLFDCLILVYREWKESRKAKREKQTDKRSKYDE